MYHEIKRNSRNIIRLFFVYIKKVRKIRRRKKDIQKLFAEKMFEEGFDGNFSVICDELKIKIETFSKWLEEDDFKEIVEICAQKRNFSEIAAVWRSLIELCKEGNIQAIKFYFELKDKYGGDKNPVTGNIIQIIDDIPKCDGDDING